MLPVRLVVVDELVVVKSLEAARRGLVEKDLHHRMVLEAGRRQLIGNLILVLAQII